MEIDLKQEAFKRVPNSLMHVGTTVKEKLCLWGFSPKDISLLSRFACATASIISSWSRSLFETICTKECVQEEDRKKECTGSWEAEALHSTHAGHAWFTANLVRVNQQDQTKYTAYSSPDVVKFPQKKV